MRAKDGKRGDVTMALGLLTLRNVFLIISVKNT
jgi:hypothetical protein